MSDGWYYAEGDKTVGPLELGEMQTVFSKTSDPRNLLVWKPGLKEWKRAEDVQELAGLISNPLIVHSPWRSAAAIAISVAAMGIANGIVAGVAMPDISVVAIGVANGIITGVAMLPVLIALDWATRRRRQFASQRRAAN